MQRLEQISKILSKTVAGKKEGLLEEGKEIIEENAEPPVKDAALIEAAQKVEHYEIASYGCASTYAKLLGYEDVEGNADKTLTEISEEINIEALEEEEAQHRSYHRITHHTTCPMF